MKKSIVIIIALLGCWWSKESLLVAMQQEESSSQEFVDQRAQFHEKQEQLQNTVMSMKTKLAALSSTFRNDGTRQGEAASGREVVINKLQELKNLKTQSSKAYEALRTSYHALKNEYNDLSPAQKSPEKKREYLQHKKYFEELSQLTKQAASLDLLTDKIITLAAEKNILQEPDLRTLGLLPLIPEKGPDQSDDTGQDKNKDQNQGQDEQKNKDREEKEQEDTEPEDQDNDKNKESEDQDEDQDQSEDKDTQGDADDSEPVDEPIDAPDINDIDAGDQSLTQDELARLLEKAAQGKDASLELAIGAVTSQAEQLQSEGEKVARQLVTLAEKKPDNITADDDRFYEQAQGLIQDQLKTMSYLLDLDLMMDAGFEALITTLSSDQPLADGANEARLKELCAQHTKILDAIKKLDGATNQLIAAYTNEAIQQAITGYRKQQEEKRAQQKALTPDLQPQVDKLKEEEAKRRGSKLTEKELAALLEKAAQGKDASLELAIGAVTNQAEQLKKEGEEVATKILALASKTQETITADDDRSYNQAQGLIQDQLKTMSYLLDLDLMMVAGFEALITTLSSEQPLAEGADENRLKELCAQHTKILDAIQKLDSATNQLIGSYTQAGSKIEQFRATQAAKKKNESSGPTPAPVLKPVLTPLLTPKLTLSLNPFFGQQIILRPTLLASTTSGISTPGVTPVVPESPSVLITPEKKSEEPQKEITKKEKDKKLSELEQKLPAKLTMFNRWISEGKYCQTIDELTTLAQEYYEIGRSNRQLFELFKEQYRIKSSGSSEEKEKNQEFSEEDVKAIAEKLQETSAGGSGGSDSKDFFKTESRLQKIVYKLESVLHALMTEAEQTIYANLKVFVPGSLTVIQEQSGIDVLGNGPLHDCLSYYFTKIQNYLYFQPVDQASDDSVYKEKMEKLKAHEENFVLNFKFKQNYFTKWSTYLAESYHQSFKKDATNDSITIDDAAKNTVSEEDQMRRLSESISNDREELDFCTALLQHLDASLKTALKNIIKQPEEMNILFLAHKYYDLEPIKQLLEDKEHVEKHIKKIEARLQKNTTYFFTKKNSSDLSGQSEKAGEKTADGITLFDAKNKEFFNQCKIMALQETTKEWRDTNNPSRPESKNMQEFINNNTYIEKLKESAASRYSGSSASSIQSIRPLDTLLSDLKERMKVVAQISVGVSTPAQKQQIFDQLMRLYQEYGAPAGLFYGVDPTSSDQAKTSSNKVREYLALVQDLVDRLTAETFSEQRSQSAVLWPLYSVYSRASWLINQATSELNLVSSAQSPSLPTSVLGSEHTQACHYKRAYFYLHYALASDFSALFSQEVTLKEQAKKHLEAIQQAIHQKSSPGTNLNKALKELFNTNDRLYLFKKISELDQFINKEKPAGSSGSSAQSADAQKRAQIIAKIKELWDTVLPSIKFSGSGTAALAGTGSTDTKSINNVTTADELSALIKIVHAALSDIKNKSVDKRPNREALHYARLFYERVWDRIALPEKPGKKEAAEGSASPADTGTKITIDDKTQSFTLLLNIAALHALLRNYYTLPDIPALNQEAIISNLKQVFAQENSDPTSWLEYLRLPSIGKSSSLLSEEQKLMKQAGALQLLIEMNELSNIKNDTKNKMPKSNPDNVAEKALTSYKESLRQIKDFAGTIHSGVETIIGSQENLAQKQEKLRQLLAARMLFYISLEKLHDKNPAPSVDDKNSETTEAKIKENYIVCLSGSEQLKSPLEIFIQEILDKNTSDLSIKQAFFVLSCINSQGQELLAQRYYDEAVLFSLLEKVNKTAEQLSQNSNTSLTKEEAYFLDEYIKYGARLLPARVTLKELDAGNRETIITFYKQSLTAFMRFIFDQNSNSEETKALSFLADRPERRVVKTMRQYQILAKELEAGATGAGTSGKAGTGSDASSLTSIQADLCKLVISKIAGVGTETATEDSSSESQEIMSDDQLVLIAYVLELFHETWKKEVEALPTQKTSSSSWSLTGLFSVFRGSGEKVTRENYDAGLKKLLQENKTETDLGSPAVPQGSSERLFALGVIERLTSASS